MNANARKWIRALRSGEFAQGAGTLEYGGSDDDNPEDSMRYYCCLGVGCMVAERNGVKVARDDDGFLLGTTLVSQRHVLKWLGLRDECGTYNKEDAVTNDNDTGIGFAGIADIIEEHSEEMFYNGD